MKRFVCTTMGLAMLGVIGVAGCGVAASEQTYWSRSMHKAIWQDTNSSQSAADRLHTYRQVVDQDARALVDDIDWITLRERPSRLSRWHNR